MINLQPSNKKSTKTYDDFTFVPNAVSGLGGVMLGWIIANHLGII